MVSTTKRTVTSAMKDGASRGGEGREVRQENKKFDDEIETAREKERKRGKDHGAFRGETHGSRAVG